MSKTITALFDTRNESDSAIRRLEQAGFTKDQVAILVSEETRGKHFGISEGTNSEKGAATGAALGGLVGVIYMALMSAGTLLVPGLNLVMTGALVGSLAGLGAGAVTGGVIGALVGVGIPEHEAKLYESAVHKGAILIAVDAGDDHEAARVQEILKGSNAQNITAVAA